MRTANWEGTVEQEWKAAVEHCTGVTEKEGYKWDSAEESPKKERKWEMEENDNIYMLLERFRAEKGKMTEGCYGPNPEDLKQLKRIQARWVCKNTVEFVRYAIEFGAVAKKKTVPERAVEVEQENGQEEDGRAGGNLNEPGLEMLAPRGEEGQAIRTVQRNYASMIPGFKIRDPRESAQPLLD